MSQQKRGRLPDWFRVPSPLAVESRRVHQILLEYGLNTVCQRAVCPNRGQCFAAGTATFLIMGPFCTRHCNFCAVPSGVPRPVDPTEPRCLVAAVGELGLRHVVVTSVTRDDLADGGACHFAAVIRELKRVPGVIVEVLTPDFGGDLAALQEVVAAGPVIFGHNLETVARLYNKVRPEADYQRSLWVLKTVKHLNARILTKSGLMVGLGETAGEVLEALLDLRANGCDMVTVGQYLQPTGGQIPAVEFIPPQMFADWEVQAKKLGFSSVVMGTLVRSSFRAAAIAAGFSVGSN